VLSAFPINKKNKGFRDMKNKMKREAKWLTTIQMNNGDMLLVAEPLDLEGFHRESAKLKYMRNKEAKQKHLETLGKVFADEIAFTYRFKNGEFDGREVRK
jgi:hypothetical protein